ncbi:MAG TPA: S24/S26 family peptidase [Mycobacteriales bacterium]|nr:S24/S26 family peptidase [Mycobacteriales bacterium]
MRWWMVPLAGVTALTWARRRLLIVRVNGVSMEPTYRDGDRLLAVRTRRPGRLRAGDVVVFDPGQPRVKRVTGLPGAVVDGTAIPAGHVYVRGDRGRSYDSALHGPVAEELVFGRALRRLARPSANPTLTPPVRPGPASVAGPGHTGG